MPGTPQRPSRTEGPTSRSSLAPVLARPRSWLNESASLLADGVKASEIVAFTFTERAGAELKDRIGLRVATLLGPAHVDQLGTMFVGTIHAYSFQLLQRYVPRFEAFDVLDPNRLTALLLREEHRLGLRLLVPGDGLFECVKAFVDAVQIVENELLDPSLSLSPSGGSTWSTAQLWIDIA